MELKLLRNNDNSSTAYDMFGSLGWSLYTDLTMVQKFQYIYKVYKFDQNELKFNIF